MTAIFLQGNARDVLAGVPSDFFHCVVTSPPYFGLRSYEGGMEVWDGDANCRHEWLDLYRKPEHRAGESNPSKEYYTKDTGNWQNGRSATCSRCGAWRGQLGAEPSPSLYVIHLVEIMREVRRVLRPDGVVWLNIGDSWAGSGGAHKPEHANPGLSKSAARCGRPLGGATYDGIKSLDVVLIPEQLALAVRADGWYVRSALIWAKGVSCSEEFNGNPMPESVNGWRWERHRVKVGNNGRGREPFRAAANGPGREQSDHDGRDFQGDAVWRDCPGCEKCTPHGGYVLRKGNWRPTDSYEHILMLTKTDSYFCDREAVLERGVYPAGERRPGGDGHKSLAAGSRTTGGLQDKDWEGNGGRNLRSVLMIPTSGFKGAHFAVFPPSLVLPLVKAATSEKGCCPECGSPYARVVDRKRMVDGEKVIAGGWPVDEAGRLGPQGVGHWRISVRSRTLGWLPTCSCTSGLPPDPCRVLDPFSGSGTTALVCERLGLDSVNVDTSGEYIKLAETRLAEDEEKRITEQVEQFRREAKETVVGG